MDNLPNGTKLGDFDFEDEDDITTYDIEEKCETFMHRAGDWTQPSLPFQTMVLSDGTEVPK